MSRQYISNIIFCVFVLSRVTPYLIDCHNLHHKIRLDEPFEFRCAVNDNKGGHYPDPTVGSKNCILTHRDGDTNETITCVSNENATPCLDDHRIIIESIVQKQSEFEQHNGFDITTTTDMLVSCSVSIQNAKSGDVGTWTLTQNQVGGPSVRASKN